MENVTNSLIRDKTNREISSRGILADYHIFFLDGFQGAGVIDS